MAEVTELAIKSVKFYKHVVQSVEKFIQKCQPEYKVPGLYVIDSIVRESRRQFGPDKDLFAPRFSKGFPATFQNLLQCPSDDKCRIVRVLNLWQKNGVFPAAIIQPLLNMSGDPSSGSREMPAGQSAKESSTLPSVQPESQLVSMSSSVAQSSISRPTKVSAVETTPKKSDVEQHECTADLQGTLLKTITQLMHQPQQQSLLPTLSLLQLQLLQQQLAQQLPMMVDSTHQQQQQQTPAIDTGLLTQIQTLTSVLMNRSSQTISPSPISGDDKKLETAEIFASMKKMKQSPSPIAFTRSPKKHETISVLAPAAILTDAIPAAIERSGRDHRPNSMERAASHKVEQWLSCSTSRLAADSTLSPKKIGLDSTGNQPEAVTERRCGVVTASGDMFERRRSRESVEIIDRSPDEFVRDRTAQFTSSKGHERSQHPDSSDVERKSGKRRSKSRSPSMSIRSRRHSRSRSSSRSKSNRRRSGSSDHRKRSRSQSGELDDGRRSRRQRTASQPPVKPQHISVYSLMLCVDHLSRQTTESDLRMELARFGRPSVSMESSRGCAYVKFATRNDAIDAYDCIYDLKIRGVTPTVRWTPGAGIKNSKLNDYFDVDSGVSYIPWSKLPCSLSSLSDGGSIDETTVPPNNQPDSMVSGISSVSPMKTSFPSSTDMHHQDFAKLVSPDHDRQQDAVGDSTSLHRPSTVSNLPPLRNDAHSNEQLFTVKPTNLIVAAPLSMPTTLATQSTLMYSPTSDTPPVTSVPHSMLPHSRFVATFNPNVPPPSFCALPPVQAKTESSDVIPPLAGSTEKQPFAEREKLMKISDDMDIEGSSSGDEFSSYHHDKTRMGSRYPEASVTTRTIAPFTPAASVTVFAPMISSFATRQIDQEPSAVSMANSSYFPPPAMVSTTALLVSSPSMMHHNNFGVVVSGMSGLSNSATAPFSQFSEGNRLLANQPTVSFGGTMPRIEGMPNISMSGALTGAQLQRFPISMPSVPGGRFLGPGEQQQSPGGWLQPPVDVSVRPPFLLTSIRGNSIPMVGEVLMRGPNEMQVEFGVRARMPMEMPPPDASGSIRESPGHGRMPLLSGPGEAFNTFNVRPQHEFVPINTNAGSGMVRGPVDMKFSLLGPGSEHLRSFPNASVTSTTSLLSMGPNGSRDNTIFVGGDSVRPYQQPIRGPGPELNQTGFIFRPPVSSEDTFRFSASMNQNISRFSSPTMRGPFDQNSSSLLGVPGSSMTTSLMMRGPMDMNSMGGSPNPAKNVGPDIQNRFPTLVNTMGQGGPQFRGHGPTNEIPFNRYTNSPNQMQPPNNDMRRCPVPLNDISRFPMGMIQSGPVDVLRGPLQMNDGGIRIAGPPQFTPQGDLTQGPYAVSEMIGRLTPVSMSGNLSSDASRGQGNVFPNNRYPSGMLTGLNEGSQLRVNGPGDNPNAMTRAPNVMFRAPGDARFEGPVGGSQFGGVLPMIRGPVDGNFLASGIRQIPPVSGDNILLPYVPRSHVGSNEGPSLLGPGPGGYHAQSGMNFRMSSVPPAGNNVEMQRNMPMQRMGNMPESMNLHSNDTNMSGPPDHLIRAMNDNIRPGESSGNQLGGFNGGGGMHVDASSSRIGHMGVGMEGASVGLPHGYGNSSGRSDDDGLPVARELLRNQLSAATGQGFRPLLGPGGSLRGPIPSLMNPGEHENRLRLPGIPQLTPSIPINERMLSSTSREPPDDPSSLPPPRLLPPPPRVGELSRTGGTSGTQRPAESNLRLGSSSSGSIPSLVAGSDILTGLGIAGGWLPQRQSARNTRGNDIRHRVGGNRSEDRSGSSWENDRRRPLSNDRQGGQARDRDRVDSQRRAQRHDVHRGSHEDTRWNFRRDWNQRRPDKRRERPRFSRRDHDGDGTSEDQQAHELKDMSGEEFVPSDRDQSDSERPSNNLLAALPSSEASKTVSADLPVICSDTPVMEIKSVSMPPDDSVSAT